MKKRTLFRPVNQHELKLIEATDFQQFSPRLPEQPIFYPVLNEAYLKEDSIEYPVSINGKKRATIKFPADMAKEDMEKAALELEVIQKWIEGKTVRKVIVVPKRMINVVVG